jgi:protein-tyrosine phosphatase
MARFAVTFVCSGNTCRSPMAEVVLAALLTRSGLAEHVVVDSYGTGDWHVGELADPRTVAALAEHGLDATTHRARVVPPARCV